MKYFIPQGSNVKITFLIIFMHFSLYYKNIKVIKLLAPSKLIDILLNRYFTFFIGVIFKNNILQQSVFCKQYYFTIECSF